MQRFIGKKISKKYVRPVINSRIPHKEPKVVENNINKEDETMNDKIARVEAVLNNDTLPKRKVKVEKKDKGLFERTEESTILLTEDNKMLLND